MSILEQTDWLEKIESMDPEQIEAILAPQPKPKRSLPSLPKVNLPNPFKEIGGWYDSLDYWEQQSLLSNCELIGFMAMPVAFFGVLSLSINGLPGQFRGAYQWANSQETPTQISFCQNQDFGVKRCKFYEKGGEYGYIESDNGGEWRNILDD